MTRATPPVQAARAPAGGIRVMMILRPVLAAPPRAGESATTPARCHHDRQRDTVTVTVTVGAVTASEPGLSDSEPDAELRLRP